ncbi:MAG TPA: hypothetical protein VKA10_07775, partial [Prolixibacteraceae bacterium]|nr:hypothetical protein [Prolixibacteraceae bacterium]
ESWTDPDWTEVGGWSEFVPDTNWVKSVKPSWEKPPKKKTIKGKFKVDVPEGNYILSLAILDPEGNVPSLRFATSNYLKGGRHPVGRIDVEKKRCLPLPKDFTYDDPGSDNSLHYEIHK